MHGVFLRVVSLHLAELWAKMTTKLIMRRARACSALGGDA
jgi:hypothetical protein